MSIDAKREAFCWLEKRKLRNIAEIFAESRVGSLVAARSVLLALSEIASDKQCDTFIAATHYIAQRAGVADKTVRRVINILKRLGFVRVRPRSANGLKLSSEYTLIRGQVSMHPIYRSLRKRQKTGLPRREELSEESKEGTARKEKDSISTNGSSDRNDDDIVVHAVTGERFNKRTKEFVF